MNLGSCPTLAEASRPRPFSLVSFRRGKRVDSDDRATVIRKLAVASASAATQGWTYRWTSSPPPRGEPQRSVRNRFAKSKDVVEVRPTAIVSPQGGKPLLRGHARSPSFLKDLEMGLHEIGTVRPQCRFPSPADRLLVLNEEGEDRLAVHDDEPGPLVVDVAQGHLLRNSGHERRVRLVDVRREPRLDPAPHRIHEDLVDPRAVRTLEAFCRREGEDLLLRRPDDLTKGAINLRAAFDHLESHRRRLPLP